MKFIAIALVLLCLIHPLKSFNYMGCSGYPPWEVDYNQSTLANDTIRLHEWLYARQHAAWRCKQYGIDSFLPEYGIGNSYLRAVISLTKDIESGVIYRPGDGYFWASNTDNCTNDIRSLDCYFHSLSSCRLNAGSIADPTIADDRMTELGKVLPSVGADICTVAKTMKKSIAWTAGQYLLYIIRPKQDIQQEIYRRNGDLLEDIDKHHYSTISVHYRGGKPDFMRKVPSLDAYMKAVHFKAAELAGDGRPVAVVYLASQDNNQIFFNESYMAATYGGNFTYKILPSFESHINTSEEIEYELKKNPLIPRKPFVVEFLADLQLLVKADCFIGSISTIYMIAMLMRYAKHPTRKKKYTCLLNEVADVICEDDDRKHDIFANYNYWILGNGGGGEDAKAGFRGGVPF